MTENRVQLDVFEGPLDLLLYLVRKEEVDIYDVNLTKVATQFIEYIDMMRQLDLEVAGEFLIMASTLMYIKSKELLPVHKQVQVEDEDEDDPRWELIRQLVEYKKFKDAAGQLQQREIDQALTYPRQPGKIEFVSEPVSRGNLSVFDLINAVNKILKRFDDRQQAGRSVYEDRWTVSEKIELLARTIQSGRKLRFSELFEETTSRTEVVVTFLALLELIRLKQLAVTQPEPFSEIDISQATPSQPDDDPETADGHKDTPSSPDASLPAPEPAASASAPPQNPAGADATTNPSPLSHS